MHRLRSAGSEGSRRATTLVDASTPRRPDVLAEPPGHVAWGGPACEARARGARRSRPARGRSSSTWPDPARAGRTARSAPPWDAHLQPPCRAAAAGPTPAAARRPAACAASPSAPRGLCASRGRCAASASPSKPGLTPRGRWRRGGRVRMRREVELTARRYPFLVGQPALSIQGRGRKDRSAYTCKCACARICCEFPLPRCPRKTTDRI